MYVRSEYMQRLQFYTFYELFYDSFIRTRILMMMGIRFYVVLLLSRLLCVLVFKVLILLKNTFKDFINQRSP